jgi:hypothetical protein
MLLINHSVFNKLAVPNAFLELGWWIEEIIPAVPSQPVEDGWWR